MLFKISTLYGFKVKFRYLKKAAIFEANSYIKLSILTEFGSIDNITYT